jgi:Flp pilus assembly pilin Flp
MTDVVLRVIIAVRTRLVALLQNGEHGQGLVEYAIILGFVSVVIVVALRFLQPAISISLNNVTNSF